MAILEIQKIYTTSEAIQVISGIDAVTEKTAEDITNTVTGTVITEITEIILTETGIIEVLSPGSSAMSMFNIKTLKGCHPCGLFEIRSR